MFDTVLTYLDSNAALWSSIPKVGAFKNEFSTLVTAIDEAQYTQQQAQVFLGKTKLQLKADIAQKADILNDCLEAFALVSDQPKLAAQMSDSYSDLYKKRNADFTPAIAAIIEAAEANFETLSAEYGVSSEQVEGLKSDLDGFLTLNGQPRAYRVASSQATQDLELLFDQANAILNNKLDKVMSIFKRRDPSFYAGYQAARVIVDS